MTVGIVLTNGKEAVTITDSRVSSHIGRQSDSINKLGLITQKNYFGTIFGAGQGNLIMHILNNTNKFSENNFKEHVNKLHEFYKTRLNLEDQSFLQAEKEEIEKKARIIPEENKKQFIDQNLSELLRKYDDPNNPSKNTIFIATGYDKNEEKIQIQYLNKLENRELNMNHVEIGSGNDASNLYIETKSQGIIFEKLDLTDLIFFGLNAYSNSTINAGVGGTPKIASTTKNGNKIITYDKTIALGNLSGAFLSNIKNPNLTQEKTKELFNDVLKDNNANYESIAKEIGLNEQALRSIYIPFSSWQESASREHYKH